MPALSYWPIRSGERIGPGAKGLVPYFTYYLGLAFLHSFSEGWCLHQIGDLAVNPAKCQIGDLTVSITHY